MWRLLLALGATLVAAPAAEASTLVYVCGKDLCRSDERGRERVRLTRDGGRAAYSRPTISHNGRRVAFKRGDPGRAFTARVGARGLREVRRIGPAPDGPPDATQFDVAISPDGRRVAWVELRINVLTGTIDYRRYMATSAGRDVRQVAASGGRPFVGWYGPDRILREGLTEAVDARQEGETVDQGICLPAPATATNGTCRGAGALQLAFDAAARHLRHPVLSPNGRLLVATAYAADASIDSAIERPGAIALFDTRTAALLRDLTSGPADSGPVFSPDGRRVAFTRRGSIWTVPTGGGRPRRLTGGSQPAWGR